jgi:hypothetical protein
MELEGGPSSQVNVEIVKYSDPLVSRAPPAIRPPFRATIKRDILMLG